MAFNPFRGVRGVGVLAGSEWYARAWCRGQDFTLRPGAFINNPFCGGGNSPTAEKGFLALRFLASSLFAKRFVELGRGKGAARARGVALWPGPQKVLNGLLLLVPSLGEVLPQSPHP